MQRKGELSNIGAVYFLWTQNMGHSFFHVNLKRNLKIIAFFYFTYQIQLVTSISVANAFLIRCEFASERLTIVFILAIWFRRLSICCRCFFVFFFSFFKLYFKIEFSAKHFTFRCWTSFPGCIIGATIAHGFDDAAISANKFSNKMLIL